MKHTFELADCHARVPSLASFRARPRTPRPRSNFDSRPNPLTLPDDIYLGEVGGVATNSKGDIFVYTRTGHPTMSHRHRAAVRARRLAAVPVRSHGQVRARDRPGHLRLHVRRAGARRSAGQHLDRRRDDRHGHEVRSAGPRRDAARTQGGSDQNPPRAGGGGGGGEGGGRGGGAPGAGAPQDVFNRPTDVAWDAAGQHLRRRRPRQRAHRQVRQGRRVRQVLGPARHRARPVRQRQQHRRRRAGQRLRRRRRQQAHPGVRQQRHLQDRVHERRQRRRRSASRRAPTRSSTSRIPIRRTTSIPPARSTRCASTERSSASSAGPESC